MADFKDIHISELEHRVQLLAKVLLSVRNKLPSGAFDAEVADIDDALQEAGQPIA